MTPVRAIGWPIGAHALVRLASGTSGVLIGLYLASLRNAGESIDAGLVGVLGATAFAAELIASIPLGLASDVLQRRWVMIGGTLAGAVAALLFAASGSRSIFFVSRLLEGVGAAAIVPSLLAYLTDITDGRPVLRARAMSYFELTLLVGLALGGIVAAQLFRVLHAGAFAAVAGLYLACAAIFFAFAANVSRTGEFRPISQLGSVLRLPGVRRLAPVWLCVNAVIGLWLGPMLPFLLTQRTQGGQYITGIFAGDPSRVGWLLFAYAFVFGCGVIAWSVVLPRASLRGSMMVGLVAMIPATALIALLNHSQHFSVAARVAAGCALALAIMIESVFTPAALAWLAQTLPVGSGRGAAMGIYSLLLSLGAIAGSLLAALLGGRYAIDGLLAGTLLVAVVSLVLLRWVPDVRISPSPKPVCEVL